MPNGTGYILEGTGWVSNITDTGRTTNCTATYYITFDIIIGNLAGLLGDGQFPRIYKELTYNFCTGEQSESTVSVFTAIITVDGGVPKAVRWDDGCFFCASIGSDCIETCLDSNTSEPLVGDPYSFCQSGACTGCMQNYATCNPFNETLSANLTSPCDLKVYVVWSGTDANGVFFTSSGQRFSLYRAYGVADLYQGTMNIYATALNGAQNALNTMQNLPGRFSGGGTSRRMRELGAAGGATVVGWWGSLLGAVRRLTGL